MALMLEIRDAGGAITRRRLDEASLAIGRALSNDIILDDPYADALHARLHVGDEGALVLEDLGSVNGLRLADEKMSTIPIVAGTIVRVGQSTFHFRDVDEPVAPAIRVEEPAIVPVPAAIALVRTGRIERAEESLGNVIRAKRGRWSIVCAELLVGGVIAWLNDYSRNATSAVLGAVVLIIGLQVVWAGIWTMSTRGSARRPTFSANYAVVALAVLVGIIATHIATLMGFLFPASEWVDVLVGACFLALLAALVSAHLAIASVSTRRKRWRTGWITSATVLGVLMVIGLLATDKTNSVPSFAHDVEPLSASVIPAQPIDRIGDDLADLKKEVDAAAEKESGAGNK